MSHETMTYGAQQENIIEEQFILRVPLRVANAIRSSNDKKELSLSFEMKTAREGKFYFQYGNEQKTYNLTLADLPTFTETHKTIDSRVYYKSADIGQIIIVEDPEEEPPLNAPILNRETWLLDSGITHPTRHIRENKWRKQYSFPVGEVQEAVKYITRLMKKDDEFELVEIMPFKNTAPTKHTPKPTNTLANVEKDHIIDTTKSNQTFTTVSDNKKSTSFKVVLTRPPETVINDDHAPAPIQVDTTTITTTTITSTTPAISEEKTPLPVVTTDNIVNESPTRASPPTENVVKPVISMEDRVRTHWKIQEITKKIAECEKLKIISETKRKTETNRVMLKRLIDDITKKDLELTQLKDQLTTLNEQLDHAT